MSKNSKVFQLVEFVLWQNAYALPINSVQEIIKLIEIIYIPKAPTFVEGVINLRNKIIPIIDLKKRFGLNNNDDNIVEINSHISLPTNSSNGKYTSETLKKSKRIIICEISSQLVGLIVDHVNQVIDVEESQFEERPAITSGIDQEFIKGMIKHKNKIIIILKPENILLNTEISMLEDINKQKIA